MCIRDNWEYNRLWFAKKISDRKIAFMDRKDRALKIISISNEGKLSFEWEKIIVDNTEHAECVVDIAEFYKFWIEYHNGVTQTLHYRKPFTMIEKFSAEDTIQFIFDVVDENRLCGNSVDKNWHDVGVVIWEGIKNV